MPEQRLSEIQFKNDPELADLPVLKAGEPAYATKNKKLYIGNPPYELTPDAGPTPGETYYLPSDAQFSTVFKVYADNIEIEKNQYTVVGNILTFNDVSIIANKSVSIAYNTQIELRQTDSSPIVTTLAPNATSSVYALDTTVFDVAFLSYSIKSADGLRVGSLRIVVDHDSQDFVVDDNFNVTTLVNVVFDGVVSGYPMFVLEATNNTANAATLSYVVNAWMS